MINIPLLMAFIGAASILVVTPGVDTAIVLRAATVSSRRAAAMAAIGIALGCLIWGAAVSLGLGALLRASEYAYTAVKLAGASYLLWQGAKLLLKPRAVLNTDVAQPTSRTSADMFWRGFLSNLLNPKVGVFYVTFLPQFVPSGANTATYCFLLACLHVALTLLWFSFLIAATVPLSGFLRRPAAVKTLDRLTGAAFVAFGLKLAASSSR
ncbi:LysE family translocator [Paraburkholderia sp. Ac-20340]|uniref:LysE family translocator n=1 Tax=Paraburkholderia sp. Ac-20340 TaxID=2703888 RepID=UPI00197F2E36|nr:LysE family translocator [Paraburkholderia sp. Ac-20340]MBN3857870.1 LysE family translocator [Paraburkholderia sp. Ac-20340]